MRVSEIRVKRIHVNQGLGVHVFCMRKLKKTFELENIRFEQASMGEVEVCLG